MSCFAAPVRNSILISLKYGAILKNEQDEFWDKTMGFYKITILSLS
jgi:hypothetical protein